MSSKDIAWLLSSIAFGLVQTTCWQNVFYLIMMEFKFSEFFFKIQQMSSKSLKILLDIDSSNNR